MAQDHQRSSGIRMPFAIAAMIGLLALTLLGPAITFLGGSESGSGNSLAQIGDTLVFVLGVVAMRPLKHPERLAVLPWPFWVALGWCWLSLAWALDPAVSLRRLVSTTIILWSAFAIVRQLGFERTLLFVRAALVIMLIVNFLTVLAFPKIGLTATGDGSILVEHWRGLMGNKNGAGLLCALTVLFFAFDRRKLPYAALAVVIALALVFLWFSESKTSFVLVGVAVAVGIGFAQIKQRHPGHELLPTTRNVILGLVVLLLIPVIHFGVQSDTFLNYIADPSGLTGRTRIWTALMRYYLDNPIFSAGFGSFWNISAVSPILTLDRSLSPGITDGHNGYLDLLVTIGLPGLILVLIAAFVFPALRLTETRQLGVASSALVAALLFFLFAHNVTETSLFDRSSIGNVFLLFALGLIWSSGDTREVGRGRPRRARAEDPTRALNRDARARLGIKSSRSECNSRR